MVPPSEWYPLFSGILIIRGGQGADGVCELGDDMWVRGFEEDGSSGISMGGWFWAEFSFGGKFLRVIGRRFFAVELFG
ncbi:unnamed protein product [Cuscuta campestris]|uniref:Uncharacterized protein n=1 Tax=Cuscuta campestris TaxID=132261 RepID=A0A484MVU1_9ASTE|nr:unnamed protein product [Cuscuta campestris]